MDQLSTDFDREKLEKTTVDDLEKLQADTEASGAGEQEEDKDEEEMKQEAEEDLQMLMGAGSGEVTKDLTATGWRISKRTSMTGSRA